MNFRSILLSAGILGAAGVGLGAFGAHKLRAVLLERGTTNAWETAVRYHLIHAVALLALASLLRAAPGRRWAWTARCWVAGTVIFSGSLYALALGGPRWLGPITPLGGVALLAGWALLIVEGWRTRPEDSVA